MLDIQFLGRVKIEYREKNVEEKLGSKAIALICLLALNRKRYISREKLEGYLWPDSNTEAARYNLRYNLWLIKKNIGPDEKNREFLKVDNECCAINRGYKCKCDIIDVMDFENSPGDTIQNILDLKKVFRGDLLEGYYFKNCDEFNDLIIFERMKFDQHKIRILKRLVELYEEQDMYKECLPVIEKILEMEPFDEDMVLKTLNIYLQLDRPVAAIGYYNNFSDILVNGLGVFPSEKLRSKYLEIKSSLEYQKEKDNQGSKAYRLAGEKQKKEINLESYCIENIKFFWMADVVGKIIKNVDPDCINQLNKSEILALGSIQGDILSYINEEERVEYTYKHQIMDVGIINAFIKLLTCIVNKYCLTITIRNSKCMDSTSANVVDYLKVSKLEGLRLIEG